MTNMDIKLIFRTNSWDLQTYNWSSSKSYKCRHWTNKLSGRFITGWKKQLRIPLSNHAHLNIWKSNDDETINSRKFECIDLGCKKDVTHKQCTLNKIEDVAQQTSVLVSVADSPPSAKADSESRPIGTPNYETIWRFSKMWDTPKNGEFIMENPI